MRKWRRLQIFPFHICEIYLEICNWTSYCFFLLSTCFLLSPDFALLFSRQFAVAHMNSRVHTFHISNMQKWCTVCNRCRFHKSRRKFSHRLGHRHTHFFFLCFCFFHFVVERTKVSIYTYIPPFYRYKFIHICNTYFFLPFPYASMLLGSVVVVVVVNCVHSFVMGSSAENSSERKY